MAIYRLQENKISSGYSNTFIINFRRKFNVIQNIQYLIFGQFIPIGGFKSDSNSKQMTFKTIKTADLRDQRNEYLEEMDDSKQMALAREQLNQFRVVKMVLLNFAIQDRNRLVLTSDITYDVLDEMRRERKILMAIRDAQIEKYIGLDITDIDMANKESHANLNQEVLFAI